MPVKALARRLALELSVIVAVGLVVGYLGPFGTFAMPPALRIGYWVVFGTVGYGFFRPTAPLACWLAARARMPLLLAVGLVLLAPALPMTAVVWTMMPGEVRSWSLLLQLYGQVWLMGMLVFSLFLAIFRDRAESPTDLGLAAPETNAPSSQITSPSLATRLPPAFGPVLALKAEDHYVRVIGETGSTLLLMRLADAIGEMDGVEGLHSHRSWWVSRAAIRSVQPRGRGAVLHLVNGETAQVARDKLAQARALAGAPA